MEDTTMVVLLHEPHLSLFPRPRLLRESHILRHPLFFGKSPSPLDLFLFRIPLCLGLLVAK
jgi:hypothetical protein